MTGFIRALFLSTAVLIVNLCGSARAAETIDREYPLKAAYIYNILKFISWPVDTQEAASDKLELCIVGPDLSDGTFFDLDGKKIDHLTIHVQAVVAYSETKSCKVLYFTDPDLNYHLGYLSPKGLLLIGQQENFLALGGTLNFFLENNKLRFEINLKAANEAGIKFSSKLLNLARIYQN